MIKPRTPRRRYRRDPFSPGSEPIPNAMEIWHILAPLDEVARQMEAKWGIERLPALVSEGTAKKFGMARDYLDQQLGANDDGAGDLAAIEAAAANLRKGWLAMDAEATAAGAPTFDPVAWSLTIAGRPAAIVRDPAAAATIQQMDTHRTVYTLAEVGNLLGVALGAVAPTIAEAKATFPGATVSMKPRSQLAEDLDDEIPF